MTSTPIKQYTRRSSCGTIALVAAAAAAAMTNPSSAFTQRQYPRRSSTLLHALIGEQNEVSRGSTVLDRPFNVIDNPSVKKHLNNNKNKNKDSSDQEEKKNMDNDEWELRLYDDQNNTREKVARVLVQVTGSSEVDAFKTMMNAHKTGCARVGKELLCYEVAEMYNEGLRKQGILSEIVPTTSDNGGNGDSSNSEWMW